MTKIPVLTSVPGNLVRLVLAPVHHYGAIGVTRLVKAIGAS